MKKNKLMTVLMAATVAAGLLTGCGSNAADMTTDATATDTATDEATDAATDAATDEAADAAATDTNADLSGSIAMAGSTSMEKLANAVAEAFMEKYPGVSVTAEFTGSSAGIESLEGGSVDIGNSSRSLKDEEKAAGCVENIVAIDGIAVVLDPANTVTDLTQDQLVQIYKGEVTNWKDLGGSDEPIVVVGREAGSGTRGAFVELTGVEEKDADGNKVDNTTSNAIISNSTEIMMTTVSGDEYAIGYSSTGSLNDTVKALNVDGVEPTAANIKDGKYSLSRPFNIATKGTPGKLAQDFIDYIMSKDGQKVVEDNGYIASVDNAKAFKTAGESGKLVVAGSSSVTPVMEKLAEAYKKVNTKAEIEIQESDSTTGMTAAADGTCDIGMASRELEDSEKDKGLTSQAIALDGIAVIVNTQNDRTDISTDMVKKIFTGEVTDWNDVTE